MYNLFRLATIVVPRLPHRLLRVLALLGGTLAWLVARNARKQATANMLHVLGTQVLTTRAGRKQLRRTVRGMFQNSVWNYLEAFSLPHIHAETIVDSLEVAGIEHLDAALALGKGVILVSAHIGPFDYLAQWLAIKGYSVTIPVEHLKDARMLDLMLKLRRSHGINFIPLGGSAPMRTILSALKKNSIVLITGDRAVQGESVEKPFFGSPARLPLGPVTLAQRTGAALVSGFGWQKTAVPRSIASKPFGGQIVPISLALPQDQRTNIDILMNCIIETLEHFISAHPEQWLVFSPIWKDTPPKS